MKTFTRRTLPHWYPPGVPFFLTFCLHGSIPEGRRYPASMDAPDAGRAFLSMDQFLHRAAFGPTYLQIPEVAEIVNQEIQSAFQQSDDQLAAWVIMPNHVHILGTAAAAGVQSPSELLRRIKGRSARFANQYLCRTGVSPFWQSETYDRWIRNPEEFASVKRYIERNPVVAGLAATPQDYRWSSTGVR